MKARDVDRILTLAQNGVQTRKIADKMKLPRHVVYYQLRQAKVPPTVGVITNALWKHGNYLTPDDFFQKNDRMTFVEMAKLLGVSLGCIQYHYRKYLKKKGDSK